MPSVASCLRVYGGGGDGDRATKKALLKDRAKRLLLQNMSEALAHCPERLYIILAAKLELVSKELNRFGVHSGRLGVIVVDLCYFALFED